MSTVYKAMTTKRAARLGLRPQRSYGYVVVMEPPKITAQTGEDVEGVGWVPYNPPRTHVQNFHGWYKHKDTAVKVASEMNK